MIIKRGIFVVAAISLLAAVWAGAEDFSARLKTLEGHVERLGAINVTEGAQAEKAQKLEALRAALQKGADSEEAYNALYMQIDEVRTWLLANSQEKPTRAKAEFEETDAAWVVRNDTLEYTLSKSDLSATVRTPATLWRMQPANEGDVDRHGAPFSFTTAGQKRAVAFHTGYSAGLSLNLSDFPTAPGAELVLGVNLVGNEIIFEVTAPGDLDLDAIQWPKPLEMGSTSADLSVIPHMQGILVPGDWPKALQSMDLSNSRTLYMPWWGQIRNIKDGRGNGVLTILETSDDGGVQYIHKPGEPIIIQPRWYASLGTLRYMRVARCVFEDDANYVSLAKRYRRYVQETGRFVSLDQKRVRTPSLDEVIGRPVVHLGALYHFVKEASLFNKKTIEANHALTTFDTLAEELRSLKAKGIDSAYVHLDGWGFYGYDNGHPDVLPVGQEQGGWAGLRAFADTCVELGYLFAVHDQYRDFYLNAVSFDDRLAALRVDGSREETSTWCGGPQTILSPRFAPEYVRRNHDLFAANGVKVRGAYLDVFSVVPLEESNQRTQPVTRSECAEYRRQCFDVLRARGYVVSSEEPSDYLVGTLDLVHHGPYPLTPLVGIPVPLFNLVYHDSLLTPWDMGEDGGWGIPSGDAGRLHCVLNAGMPYIAPGADEQMVARVKEACELNRRCARLEMVNHEYLDGNYRRQRSRFADGTSVTVDFDAKTSQIDYK